MIQYPNSSTWPLRYRFSIFNSLICSDGPTWGREGAVAPSKILKIYLRVFLWQARIYPPKFLLEQKYVIKHIWVHPNPSDNKSSRPLAIVSHTLSERHPLILVPSCRNFSLYLFFIFFPSFSSFLSSCFSCFLLWVFLSVDP